MTADRDPTGPELTEEEFAAFRDLIYKQAGIRIPANKRVLVTNRVRRRLRATGIARFADYLAMLGSPRGVAELPCFLDEITTNETFFDRDPHQYDWFSRDFLDELARDAEARRRPRKLRVWSAACSTGEEVYSLILRWLDRRPPLAGWAATFLGTDLSNAVLNSARAGSYESRSLRLIHDDRRKRYFDADPTGDRWTIKPEVRALATWKRHNLLQPLRPPVPPFDCIVLKNVLIYFDLASKKVVVQHLLNALAPGGYLMIGPTEGVTPLLGGLTRIQPWLYRSSATP